MYNLAKMACGTLAASLVLLAAPSVQAAHESAETLAHRLHSQTQSLAVEIRDGFRFSPEYRHLVSDAIDVLRSAEHVHEQAHEGASPAHLHRDLHEFEHDLNHLRGVLRDAELQAGPLGHIGHIDLGRVNLNVRFAPDTRSVYRILHQVEDTAQRLDIEIERLAARPRHRDIHDLNGFAYPLGGGRAGGPAWSYIGNRGLEIRIGR